MFEQANSPSTASKSASQSKDNIMADWEVIDGPKASADSVKKPPPPAVKEKPRNKPTAGDNDTESKGVSVLAAAQSSSLANVLQKGLQKPAKVSQEPPYYSYECMCVHRIHLILLRAQDRVQVLLLEPSQPRRDRAR